MTNEMRAAGSLSGDANPDEPEPLMAGETPTPWLANSGVVAHPNAPAGAGGHGNFRGQRHLGARANQALSLAHPSSPKGRHNLSPADSSRVELGKKKKNPPPTTKVESKTISKTIGITKINVTVKVLADVVKKFKQDPHHQGKAATKLDVSKVALKDSYDDNSPPGVVKNPRWEYTGDITIQTTYLPSVKTDAESGYGRGTTDDDRTNGDITLGFHESCHRNDFWTYYTTKQFPLFAATDGMSKEDYEKKVTEIVQAWQDFEDKAQDESEAATDEVGDPPLSEF